MNKYEYHWRDSMRLRAGLQWKTDRPSYGDYPSMPKCILLLLLVFILMSWAQDRQYAEEMIAEAARQEAIAEKRANQIGECIEGVARFTTPNATGKGYGLTVTACRKAEHFDI